MAKLPDHPNWMKYVDGNLTLSELTIPGTHDTGTFRLQSLGPAKCQELKLSEQLQAGIRFLDIRVAKGDKNDGVLWLYHGKPPLGVPLNVTFAAIADYCYGFLEANPSETILMSVKQEFGDSIARWFKSTISSRHDQWYLGNSEVPKLDEVRGKIVLLRRFDNSGIGLDLFDQFPDDDTKDFSNNGVDYHVQDNYYKWSKGNNKADKFNIWVRDALIAAEHGSRSTVFINFTSGTGVWAGVLPFMTQPYQLAQTVMPLFYDYLQDRRPLSRYGIIPMDFPEIRPYVISCLINCNYKNPMVFPRLRNRLTGAIYLNFDGELHHIPHVEIADHLFKKGYDWQALPNFDFPMPKEGLPLANGMIIRFSGQAALYLSYTVSRTQQTVLKHIANEEVQKMYGLFGDPYVVPESTKGNYTIQSPLTGL
jgi:1-phosphatidylinositol phosphodiesterase